MISRRIKSLLSSSLTRHITPLSFGEGSGVRPLSGVGLLLLLLLLPVASSAQHLAGRAIAIENMSVTADGRNVLVDMDLRLDSLRMPSNRRLIFTPVIAGSVDTVSLPRIVVNGRRQDVMWRRGGGKAFAEGTTVVARKNGEAQTVHYSAVAPWQPWMKNYDVSVHEDLCGCGDTLDTSLTPLYAMRTPAMVYIRPEATGIKARADSGRAFIDFPVDRTELHPDYRENPRELAKIVSTINLVKEDKNVSITAIDIHGYASPESPYSHNAWLAETRAATLKDYVRRQVELPDSLFTVSSTPEDWQGLHDFVEKSNLDNRTAILALIDDPSLEPDPKEQQLKKLYPDDYRFLLTACYPALRHSDYVVQYTVRPFTVDEARELLRTKPQQLSLEEMYLVAQTYEPGSAEFDEVFAIAVRMYPTDPTANLNAACTEIERGDYEAAERYLAKAGDTPQVLYARGAIAMKQGRMKEAIQLFERASQYGIKEADDMKKELDRILKD